MDYEIKDSQTRKNLNSYVALEKQSSRWIEDSFGSVKCRIKLVSEEGLTTFDSLKSFKQKLNINARSRIVGNVNMAK